MRLPQTPEKRIDEEEFGSMVDYAMEHGVYVSLNMLCFPGFNDREEEIAAWTDFFRALPVPMIQVRNLNMDPDAFWAAMPPAEGKMIGTLEFLKTIHEIFPDMIIGSFSHYVKNDGEEQEQTGRRRRRR